MTKETKEVVPQCGNCIFGKDSETKRHGVRVIICRRNPPSQGDRQDRPGLYPFPMLNETEWCGEHKPNLE